MAAGVPEKNVKYVLNVILYLTCEFAMYLYNLAIFIVFQKYV